MEYTTTYPSPIGLITLASDGKNLTGLWIENQKYFERTLDENTSEKNLPIFKDVKNWLNSYFNKEKPALTLPLAPKGTPFQQAVWDILLDIPYGQVITYGEIGQKIAQANGKTKMSAQAVGGAVGHNPISIIIPCHRVVGAKGSLTGYASGIDKKIQLLQLEDINMATFFIPKKGTAL